GHERAELDRFARRLAKLGVNMVRLQVPLWREDDVTRVDGAKLERIHRLVAALKKEGIYLALSSFWPYWLTGKGLPGLEGLGGGKLLQMLGRGKVAGDDPAAGRAGFMPLSEMLSRRDARARDTAEFLAELQRRYFDQMYRYLKNDLGFKGSVTGSNWITADARL